MFEFKRLKNQIRLDINPNIPGAENWSFYFRRESSDEPSAQLLLNAFENEMRKQLKTTRQKYYDAGYKDAKAKRKKCDWFGGWW